MASIKKGNMVAMRLAQYCNAMISVPLTVTVFNTAHKVAGRLTLCV